jgi:hypothetical protein
LKESSIMALIFSRLAHNFIKNGYYPTDEVTLGRIVQALECAGTTARVYDPTCGEGSALADVKAHLLGVSHPAARIEAYGVEFDRERAWHAKELLDHAIHSDVHDVVVSPRSMGLLFLNPPYGLGVSDKALMGDQERAEHLEMTFLRKCLPNLVNQGVLVFIVPYYAITVEMATFLARHLKNIRCYMAPDQSFRQCVIFGVKDKPKHPPQATLVKFAQIREGQDLDQVLPESWPHEHYQVPEVIDDPDFRFHAVRIDPAQLSHELQRLSASTLWMQFGLHFNQDHKGHRRPLRDMTKWHLALCLAAGQVSGVVRSKATGRTLLIKGDTHKRKERSVVNETDEKGNVTQTVTMLDKFVPVINAIEFTPGTALGQIVTIT